MQIDGERENETAVESYRKGGISNLWKRDRDEILYTFEAVALFSLFMPRCQQASDRTVEWTNEQGRKISGIDSTLFGKQYIMIVNFATHTSSIWTTIPCLTKVKKTSVLYKCLLWPLREKNVSIFSSYWFYLVKYSMLGIEDFRAGFFLSKLQSSFFCHGIFILILYKFFSCDFYHFLEMIESRMAIEVEKGTEYSSLRQKRKRNTAYVIVLFILVPLFLCVCGCVEEGHWTFWP